MDRKYVLTGIIALAVIALGIIAWLAFSGGSSNEMLANTNGGLPVALSPRDHPMGSPKAPVVMVEYAAPTCPHCARFDQEIFPQLKATYIDTGKVYYIFRVFPLNQVDIAAEAIARCMPQQNYMSFIDLLYRNQPKWDPEYGVTDVHAGLVAMGRLAGMSAEQVDACIGNQDEAKKIEQVGTEAQTKYGIDGTPTFIVNGEKRVGESTWADWQSYLNGKLRGK